MKINWDRVWVWLGRLFACFCAVVMLAVLTFCSGPSGCTSSTRTTPASASVTETTRAPDGSVKVRQATSTTTSGAATGDVTKLKQDTGAPTAEVAPDGRMVANGGTSESDLSAKVKGYSLFYFCAIILFAGAMLAFYLEQFTSGKHMLIHGVLFALCGWNPLVLLGVAVYDVVSLFHSGMAQGALRAVIAASGGVTGTLWSQITSKLAGPGSPATFGDHTAVKAAEKAEV